MLLKASMLICVLTGTILAEGTKDEKILNSVFDMGSESAKNIKQNVSSKEKTSEQEKSKNDTIDKNSSTTSQSEETKKIKDISEFKPEDILVKMGKGTKLTDKEINLSLLTFAKEEELKKANLKAKKEAKKKKELKKMLVQETPNETKTQSISLEEQKRRLALGLPQFPTQSNSVSGKNNNNTTGQKNVGMNALKKLFTNILFYGTSCVGKECVAFGKDNVVYKMGQMFEGGKGSEKIVSIERNIVKTDKRTFDLTKQRETKKEKPKAAPVTRGTNSGKI